MIETNQVSLSFGWNCLRSTIMLVFPFLVFSVVYTVASPDAESKDVVTDSINENIKTNWNNFTDVFYQTNSDKFYVSKVSINWDGAVKSCKDAGMVLASITSQSEQLALFKLLFVNDLVPADDVSGYWLSGRQTDNRLYRWTSVDKQINCWGWLSDEPNNEFTEHCVELKLRTQSVRIGWNNVSCDTERRFICQQLQNFNKDGSADQEEDTNEEVKEQPNLNCYRLYTMRGFPFQRLGK